MPRDYKWAAQSLPPDLVSIGELGILLGLGRHQARRLLLKSGYPCKLYTKHWRGDNGRGYTRRTYGIPPVTFRLLLKERSAFWMQRALRAMGRLMTRAERRQMQPGVDWLLQRTRQLHPPPLPLVEGHGTSRPATGDLGDLSKPYTGA